MAMELDQFLSEIFPHKDRENNATPRRLLEYSNLQVHIEEILEQHETQNEPAIVDPEEKALTDGRIGPDIVGIDRNSLFDSMNVKEGIEVESQSNFSSVRANVCVCKGKWMYEILLGSKGIMQLGWATLECRFTNEEGVGDTACSYAYDGHRVRKWNVTTAKYGEEWMAGDVIGCTIDLDNGKITYTRNGKDLGVAFDNVKFGPGLAYFPAVSLSYGESCQLNFGALPFKYPVEGYKPLQDPPVASLAKAKELICFLNNLLPAPDRVAQLPQSFLCKADTITLLTTAHVFERLSPLLIKGYVVEEVLLPFLLNSCSGENPLAHQPGVHKIIDLMWACMEEYELEPCLDHLLYALIKTYWYNPVTMDFQDQMHCLSLVLNIFKHERTRRIWIKSKMCPQKFSYFMHIRPPDDHILRSYFPVVWWDSEDESIQPSHENKEHYLSAAAKLKTRVQVLEAVQVEICKILLRDDEDQSQNLPSTRKVFLGKFRKFLQENMSTTMTAFMQPQPSSACTGPVVTCFYHRLIQALRWHWDKAATEETLPSSSTEAYVPFEKFHNDDIQYWDISRLGGLLSHLKKTRSDAIKEAGTKADSKQPNAEYCPKNEVTHNPLLVEMLDGIYMLYHIAVHKQFSKVRAVRENMQQNVKALEETITKIRQCSDERTDVLAELQRSKRVFMDEARNCARHMAWVSNLIFTKEKQKDLHWMLITLLTSLDRAGTHGALFEFTPEFYIEVAVNSFHALRGYYHPTVDFQDIPEASNTLDRMALFLCTHFTDQRIINPDLKDVIIQSLATFVCYKDSLTAIEKMSEDIQEKTLRSLMGAYDKRSWVQTTWILVRVWKGCGFAFRYTNPHDVIAVGLPEHAPCFSTVLQQQLAKLSLADNSLAKEFLNGVLNQLNWAFSEFIGLLQEIQQATNRMETVLDTRQLRSCAVCFDLTVGLLRVLEMVSTVAPALFTDWKRESAELHIARLFQLLTQVLNRVTSSGNLFENVIRLRLPGLETVDRFPVLGAVTGIMLALLLQGTPESKERATSALLAEPGFHIESVEFLIGGKPKAVKSAGNFSFKTIGKDVSEDEVRMVEKLVSYLEKESSQALLQKQESVDVDELCAICCAVKKSVKFLPCGHVSCRSCITRHLMNNKECFFCKMSVTEVVCIDRDTELANTPET